MVLTIKNLFSKKSKNSNLENNYKYDNLIDKQIKLCKIEKKIDYQIGDFKVNRKIPNKEELNKIYNNFIKKKNIIIINKKFKFIKKIEHLRLLNDNQFVLINLNLIKDKRYKLSINFFIDNYSNISFILNNNYDSKIFKSNNLKGNILFNTNYNFLSNYNELYILFDKKKEIFIKDLLISINEINNNSDYNIFLIKCNNKVIIY